MMKKNLCRPAIAGMVLFALNCNDTSHSENPVLGNWNVLWAGSQIKRLDFNLSFEDNNSFHVIVSGGRQSQPEKISGSYNITHDTLLILDKSDEPIQLCDYKDTGWYTFTRRADTLLFKVINDRCERRKLTLEMGLRKAG